MPELPEVETTRRGVEPHVLGRKVTAVRVHDRRLRWPVPNALARELPGHEIEQVQRRAKYLLFRAGSHSLIIHLGMSGRLRVVPAGLPAGTHDHLDILFDSETMLRLHDPRRFGCVLWVRGNPLHHALLQSLGPEPFGPDFSGDYLFDRSRKRKTAVKNFLMDSHIVVGVGNIYASEALFRAGIHPLRAAGRIAHPRYALLVVAVRKVLDEAIQQGGTTLRDFAGADGAAGYFKQRLEVYDRAGEPCPRCNTTIKQRVIGQRSSYYCPRCQY